MIRMLDNFVAQLEHSRDVRAALDILAATLEPLGFTRVDFGYVDRPRDADGRLRPISLVYHNFPKDWERRWERFSAHDPIYLAGLDSTVPVDLTEFRTGRRPCALERDAWEYLDDVGMSCGIVVPARLPSGHFSSVAAYWRQGVLHREWKRAFTRNHDMLFILGHYFCDVTCRRFIFGTPTAAVLRLTQREVECLSLAARGKTTKEAASILGRSTATVRFHLEKAMRKLGTPNRTAAVARACALGWIRTEQ